MLTTEQANPQSAALDTLSVREIVRLMNDEDRAAVTAVTSILPQVEAITSEVVGRFRAGGRLVFAGAGTSGRLGILEAAECPPTFGLPSDRVVALMAGAPGSVFRAAEGLEDDAGAGAAAIAAAAVGPADCVIGLTASGSTPYALGALRAAHAAGAFTALVAANPPPPAALPDIDVAIALPTGPEVLTGSTRLKAATATKMVLNMITTAAMVRLGRTYKNRMSQIRTGNRKLRRRAVITLMEACGLGEAAADALLARTGERLPAAILSAVTGADPARAVRTLDACGDDLNAAVKALAHEPRQDPRP